MENETITYEAVVGEPTKVKIVTEKEVEASDVLLPFEEAVALAENAVNDYKYRIEKRKADMMTEEANLITLEANVVEANKAKTSKEAEFTKMGVTVPGEVTE